jgi:hypothetical protein
MKWILLCLILLGCAGKEGSGIEGYVNCDCSCAKQIFMQRCAEHLPATQCRNNWEDIRGDAYNCANPSTYVEAE